MRERLWLELVYAKFNDIYCLHLSTRHGIILRNYNILLLTFSSAGVMGWAFWKNFPLASCIIVSGMSLLKLLNNHIVPTEQGIQSLNKISEFYSDYFNKLESLWFDYFNERIDEEEVQKKFYQLKETEKDTNKLVNDLLKKPKKKISSNAEIEANVYMNRTFK